MLVKIMHDKINSVEQIESIKYCRRRIIIYDKCDGTYSISILNFSKINGKPVVDFINRPKNDIIYNVFGYCGTIVNPLDKDNNLNYLSLVKLEDNFYNIKIKDYYEFDKGGNDILNYSMSGSYYYSEFPTYSNNFILGIPSPKYYNEEHQVIMENLKDDAIPFYDLRSSIFNYSNNNNGTTNFSKNIYTLGELIDNRTSVHIIKLNKVLFPLMCSEEQFMLQNNGMYKELNDAIESIATEIYDFIFSNFINNLTLLMHNEEGFKIENLQMNKDFEELYKRKHDIRILYKRLLLYLEEIYTEHVLENLYFRNEHKEILTLFNFNILKLDVRIVEKLYKSNNKIKDNVGGTINNYSTDIPYLVYY